MQAKLRKYSMSPSDQDTAKLRSKHQQDIKNRTLVRIFTTLEAQEFIPITDGTTTMTKFNSLSR